MSALKTDTEGVPLGEVSTAVRWRAFVASLEGIAGRAKAARRPTPPRSPQARALAGVIRERIAAHLRELFGCAGCGHRMRAHPWGFVDPDVARRARAGELLSERGVYCRAGCRHCCCDCFVDPRVPLRQARALALGLPPLPPTERTTFPSESAGGARARCASRR